LNENVLQMISNGVTFYFVLSHVLIVLDEGKHGHPCVVKVQCLQRWT